MLPSKRQRFKMAGGYGFFIPRKKLEGCRVTARQGVMLTRVLMNCVHHKYPIKTYQSLKRLIILY